MRDETKALLYALRVHRITRRLATDCHRREIAAIYRKRLAESGSRSLRMAIMIGGANAIREISESNDAMKVMFTFDIGEQLERSYRRCKPVSAAVILGDGDQE